MTNREQRRLQQSLERRQAKQDQTSKSRAPSRPAATPRPARGPASDKNVFQRLVHFLGEVRNELRRVSWPTRAQMVAFTTVVLITSGAITAYVFALDQGFRDAILFVLGANR